MKNNLICQKIAYGVILFGFKFKTDLQIEV